MHDCKSIYRVPLLLAGQNVVPFFANRLKLEIRSPQPRYFLSHWKKLAERYIYIKFQGFIPGEVRGEGVSG